MYLEVVCGSKRLKKYALMRVLFFPQKVLIVTPGIYYYSRLNSICIYDDFFVSQNAPTDAEHAKPALADVGALFRIGVVIAMLIEKRTVESVNMKVSNKINEI